jgi:serine/threonine-protein kinase
MVTSDLGACEWFVWDLRRSGLIDRGQLDTIVSDYLKRNPRAEAPALAEHLVNHGTLTGFQAERILNGKTQGLVLGPYVLLDAIGSGSMGQVYKASSKNDEHQYAVKVLPRRSMWNVRLARRQVRSFGQFSQPAVVPFVDVGTAGGLHYLVWTLADGTNLEALVQQSGKLPTNQATLYAIQIAQGLTVAHQNNLFHGLLKPSNVMVGPDNQARILDFGIGSLLVENEGESLVDTMSTANTLTSGLDCAAPESIMDPTNRTPAGDQYSLGCLLYYCLTGRVPFPEGSAVEKMMAHQLKEPMPITDLAPGVPEKLVAVVKRLMAKKPEDRFTGCDELVEVLEPFLGNPSEIPGGIPANSGSGRVTMTALSRTGGPGSHHGSSHRLPGLPGSNPGNRPLPPGSHPGNRPIPAGSNPGTRLNPLAQPKGQTTGGLPKPKSTPPPNRPGPSLPSRASFQLPPLADEIIDTGPSAHTDTPSDTPKPRHPPRATSWTDDPDPTARTAQFGPVGLVAAALLLMVAVYYGATLLMK